MITNTHRLLKVGTPYQCWASAIDISCCNTARHPRPSPIFCAKQTVAHSCDTAYCPVLTYAAFSPLQIKAHLSVIARTPALTTWRAVIDKMPCPVLAAGVFGDNLPGLRGKAITFSHRPDLIAGLRDRSF